MPELPEVETIKLGLQKYLVGHEILDIEVKVAKIFQGNTKDVIGAKIVDVKRIGKGLIIGLNNDYNLAIHLKLTGQLVFIDNKTQNTKLSPKTGGALPSKHTHIIFKLNNEAFLYYNDLRKFGWIKVIQKDKINELLFFKELGPEPFGDLTFLKFIKIIRLVKSPIKSILMDQKKIAGIGNIYANEALFLAQVDPRRKTNTLSDKEIHKLYASILEVLKRGLKYGGSSDINYVNALGQDGQYQKHFLIYNKRGVKCQRCDGIIQKIQLGGRGTYFCPQCQK